MLRLNILRCACFVATTIIATAFLPQAASTSWAQSTPIDFDHEIVPILRTHCVTCHGGREMEGGFSVNTRDDIVASGMVDLSDVEASRLIELITSVDADDQMPPADRPRLEAREVELLRQWIGRGLPWDEQFSFAIDHYEPPLRPRSVVLPAPHAGREHPIDRILDNYFIARHQPIPPAVDDDAFLRRASLDLIGLLPTTEELLRFRQDASPDKRAQLISELLDRKIDYADHWLTFFNDLLRNDYSGTGFITGGRKQISKWLYEALLANKPFDQLTRELVAPPTADSRGYIDGIQWRGNVSAGQTIEIQFSQSISQSFLGINMKCASCHDSFIDRWTLKEAYGLGAIYAEEPLQLHRCDKPTGETQSAAWLFPELGQVDPAAPRDERLRQLSLLMTHPQNGRFSRTIVNRLWHRLLGRGIVHPLDAMQSEPWSADLLDYLANQLVENQYDLKSILELIASSQAYQAVTASDAPAGSASNYCYRGPIARRMTAEQFMDSVWQLTGAAPRSFDAPVFRYDLSQVDVAAIEVKGNWIWGPLTHNQAAAEETLLLRKVLTLPADVVSGGAVVTCDNEFTLYVGNREIASSEDWTQLKSIVLRDVLKSGKNTLIFRVKNGGAAGTQGPAGLFFDARITLADGSSQTIASDSSWEYHQHVPEAREGRLTAPAKGWQKVSLVDPPAVWQELLAREARSMLAVAGLAADQLPMVRAALTKNTALMQSLGRPMRDQIVSMRPTGLTTLEAIDLANEPTLAANFAQGGKRWSEANWASTEALVEELFLSALSREPTSAERQLFVDFLGEQPQAAALSDALWTLCMLPEFMLIR